MQAMRSVHVILLRYYLSAFKFIKERTHMIQSISHIFDDKMNHLMSYWKIWFEFIEKYSLTESIVRKNTDAVIFNDAEAIRSSIDRKPFFDFKNDF